MISIDLALLWAFSAGWICFYLGGIYSLRIVEHRVEARAMRTMVRLPKTRVYRCRDSGEAAALAAGDDDASGPVTGDDEHTKHCSEADGT